MEPILQHIFNKSSLQQVEAGALEALSREYPYFAAAQYFYTQGLQMGNQPLYADQYQKTLLYFNNPLWLKYQLDQSQTTKHDPGARSFTPEVATLEFTTGLPGSSPDLIEDVVLHQEKDYLNPEEGQIHSKGFDNIDRALAQTSSEISALVHPVPHQTQAAENPLQPLNETNGKVQTDVSLQGTEADATEDHGLPPGDLPLQAYHTVDYFASQGIKLSQEALSNDKLGKQMKSFTEWLKTMRRLPEPVVEEVLEKIDDSDVAKYAAHSLEEKEIVTEAMAEVLGKQGKTARAIEIYQKLSLLNLHKSAYFAAKIEGLKQH